MTSEKIQSAEVIERIESELTSLRIEELRFNPVVGNFDVEHLKEINRRIFQDLPNVWKAEGFVQKYPNVADKIPTHYLDYIPGSFRNEVVANEWKKERKYESYNVKHTVVYSRMTSENVEHLEIVLQSATPEKLKNLSSDEFTKYIGDLYAELDYIHPFPEGNSRTLREFTRELADKSGFSLNWEKFNENEKTRDQLYIARDLAVIEKALPYIEDERTLRAVSLTKFTFKNLPHIQNVLEQDGVILKKKLVKDLTAKEIMSLPISERPQAVYKPPVANKGLKR